MKHSKMNIGLRSIVLVTLLSIGIVPLLTTGWLLSDRSGRELRSAEGRYQTQLVQDKARQIEMFGQNYSDLVRAVRESVRIYGGQANHSFRKKPGANQSDVKRKPELLSLTVRPLQGESLSAFRSNVRTGAEERSLSASALGEFDDKQVSIGSPQISSKTGELVMAVAAPIRINDSFLPRLLRWCRLVI